MRKRELFGFRRKRARRKAICSKQRAGKPKRLRTLAERERQAKTDACLVPSCPLANTGFHLRYLRKPRDTQQISLPVLLVLFFKLALFSRCVNIEALNGFFC